MDVGGIERNGIPSDSHQQNRVTPANSPTVTGAHQTGVNHLLNKNNNQPPPIIRPTKRHAINLGRSGEKKDDSGLGKLIVEKANRLKATLAQTAGKRVKDSLSDPEKQ